MICLFLPLSPPHSSHITLVAQAHVTGLPRINIRTFQHGRKKKRKSQECKRANRNYFTLKDRKRCDKTIKHSPRRGDWRRPFHIAGPSCNPRPSCNAAVLGGRWRRGPGKTPHTSSPGRSALWMSVAPLSCGSRMQTAAAYTQTLHWSDETQKWMAVCQVYCPETDYAGTESRLCSSVSLWKLMEL